MIPFMCLDLIAGVTSAAVLLLVIMIVVLLVVRYKKDNTFKLL